VTIHPKATQSFPRNIPEDYESSPPQGLFEDWVVYQNHEIEKNLQVLRSTAGQIACQGEETGNQAAAGAPRRGRRQAS
jgi:hypothetical protein